jgi:hypothetical protein
MARQMENSNRNFSADHDTAEVELRRLMVEPPARLEDLFDNPVIREHVAKLIVNAIRRSDWS